LYLFSFSFFTAQTMPSCFATVTLVPVISAELLAGFVCSLVFSPSHKIAAADWPGHETVFWNRWRALAARPHGDLLTWALV